MRAFKEDRHSGSSTHIRVGRNSNPRDPPFLPLQTEAKTLENPVEYLAGFVEEFPFDVVVADECQRYIGETDGYSTLLVFLATISIGLVFFSSGSKSDS